MGAVTLNDALFEGCRLDYAAFENACSSDTVSFDRWVLTDATFTGGVLLDLAQSDQLARAVLTDLGATIRSLDQP
ncbi:hypothetical protein ACI1MP_32260 [Kitasatospora griseola]|uniref:hypothetical protein n=1 Tax=Kitasatospora griseola TaxID=2064 RepID=UPI0038557C29